MNPRLLGARNRKAKPMQVIDLKNRRCEMLEESQRILNELYDFLEDKKKFLAEQRMIQLYTMVAKVFDDIDTSI